MVTHTQLLQRSARAAVVAFLGLAFAAAAIGAAAQEISAVNPAIATTLVQVLPVAGRIGVTEPWNVLDAKLKVSFIEGLITRGLSQKIPSLLDGL